jgi:hypothetical protein
MGSKVTVDFGTVTSPRRKNGAVLNDYAQGGNNENENMPKHDINAELFATGRYYKTF